MSEREALLRAVCENPDEDTPRLVFADWLQENGEEARAEFICAQVRHAERLRNAAPDTPGHAARARELWLQYGTQWRAELPVVSGLSWHDAFSRGFVEIASIASDTELVRHADAVFSQPIRHLAIGTFRGVAGFSALRGLRWLKTLSLGNRRANPKYLTELLKCDSFSESLMLSCHFGQDGREFAHELSKAFGSRLYTPVLRKPS